jgi:hypothetical protein
VDGRGIQPDINVDSEKNNDWIKEVQGQLVLFDFVTQNMSQFSQIDTSGNFILPNNTILNFAQYLEKINFKPHTENWKKLNEFKEKNNVDSENIEAHIQAIEKIILPDNKKQSQVYQDYLSHLLETEIVRRTKNERAFSRQAIKKDPVVLQALSTLKSDYKKILLVP